MSRAETQSRGEGVGRKERIDQKNWKRVKLADVADFSTETVKTDLIDLEWYIGTENMLANCEGVVKNTIPIQYGQVRLYRKRDILISNIRPYLKKIWLATRDGGCSTDVNVIHGNGNEFSSDLLYYALSQDAFFDYIMSNAIGTKMPRGDKDIIRNFEFDLPTEKNEQQKIVLGFSAINNHIAVVQKLISKYEAIKKATVKLLLKPKNGWRRVKIEDIFEIKVGGDLDIAHYSKTKTSFYRYEVVSNSLSNRGLYGYTSLPKFPADSITITGRGNVGHAEYRDDQFDAIVRIVVLSPIGASVCAKFVAELINITSPFQIESTGVPQLTAPQISAAIISLPTIDDQNRIVVTLDTIDNTIKGLKAQLEKSQAIKQGMMTYFFG